jgi:hypothetical protein
MASPFSCVHGMSLCRCLGRFPIDYAERTIERPRVLRRKMVEVAIPTSHE